MRKQTTKINLRVSDRKENKPYIAKMVKKQDGFEREFLQTKREYNDIYVTLVIDEYLEIGTILEIRGNIDMNPNLAHRTWALVLCNEESKGKLIFFGDADKKEEFGKVNKLMRGISPAIVLEEKKLKDIPEQYLYKPFARSFRFLRVKAIESGYSGKLIDAEEEYLFRKNGVRTPKGEWRGSSGTGPWTPDETGELCGCCAYIREPSWRYPLSMYKHCCSKEHIANLMQVELIDLAKIDKFYRLTYKANKAEHDSLSAIKNLFENGCRE